jgi:hypothetical protein
MNVQEIINLFGGKQWIFSQLSETPSFYYRPKYFFKRFFAKPAMEKFAVFLLYMVLFAFFGNIVLDITYKLTFKILAADTLSTLLMSFILILTKGTIGKIFNVRIKNEDCFYYVFLCKFLILPLTVLSLILFKYTELYGFLFTWFLLAISLHIYFLLIFWVIVYKKLKHILAGLLFSYLFYNVLFFGVGLIPIDKYTDLSKYDEFDMVAEEFNKYIAPYFAYTFDFPDYILYEAKPEDTLETAGSTITMYYYCIFENLSLDSAAKDLKKLSVRSNNYMKFFVDSVKMVKPVKDSLKHKRNIIWYESIQDIENIIRNDISTKFKYDSVLVADRKIINEKLYIMIMYPPKTIHAAAKLVRKQISDQKVKDLAGKPLELWIKYYCFWDEIINTMP